MDPRGGEHVVPIDEDSRLRQVTRVPFRRVRTDAEGLLAECVQRLRVDLGGVPDQARTSTSRGEAPARSSSVTIFSCSDFTMSGWSSATFRSCIGSSAVLNNWIGSDHATNCK